MAWPTSEEFIQVYCRVETLQALQPGQLPKKALRRISVTTAPYNSKREKNVCKANMFTQRQKYAFPLFLLDL